MVNVDSGPVVASDRFSQTPKSKWRDLVRAKKYFLETKLSHDCRCLVEFVEEAETVWYEIGYESPEDMIRNGYGLDPVEINLAVAWLKHNEPGLEISISDVKEKQIAEARGNPITGHGGDRKSDPVKAKIEQARELPACAHNESKRKDQGTNSTLIARGGNTTYTLRRLARDAPELLDAIELGELSVNAAAIKAGIRKVPTPLETCVKAFAKCEDKSEAIATILKQVPVIATDTGTAVKQVMAIWERSDDISRKAMHVWINDQFKS